MPTLTINQAATYARNAGFSGDNLVTILALAMAESNLNTDVVNSIGAVGILQIYLKYHPEVSMAQAKDPQFSFNYAYKLSSGGKNFCAWQSYDCVVCGNCGPKGWDNRYKQFLPQVQAALNSASGGTMSTTPVKNYKQGNGNPFDPTFRGQCTWWAQMRYHQLTGLWTPMLGNAYQWDAQARAAGWEVSSTPPNGIPSIICMQGNAGQGLLPNLGGKFGHVAIVESINPDGSVVTSNMDWSVGSNFNTTINTYGYPVKTVTFHPGTGVSFIYTGTPVNDAAFGQGSSSAPQSPASMGKYIPIISQVHETLVTVPGFYGIAIAIDKAEQFPGWIDLTDTSKVWDVTGWLRSAGASVTDNFAPFCIRAGMMTIGTIIIILLITRFIFDVGDKAIPIIKSAGALAA